MISAFIDSFDLVDWSNPINRSHPLARGLIGWWLVVPNRMGWGTTTWRDLCGSFNGTLTNMSASSDWVGQGNGSLDLDGTNDYVKVPFSSKFDRLTTLTALCHCYLTASSGNNEGILSKWNTTDEDFILWGGNTDSNISFGADSSATTVWSGGWSTLQDSKWHTLGFTRNGQTVNIYADGVSKATATNAGNQPGANTTDQAINFGSYADDNFSGAAPIRFKSVSLWSRTLSSAEVASHNRETQQGYPGLLNRIPLPLAMMEQAAGGTILPMFNHYQCSQQAD